MTQQRGFKEIGAGIKYGKHEAGGFSAQYGKGRYGGSERKGKSVPSTENRTGSSWRWSKRDVGVRA